MRSLSLKKREGEVCREINVIVNLKNIGEGLAINIKIQPIRVGENEYKKDAYVYTEEVEGFSKGETRAIRFFEDTKVSCAYNLEDRLLQGESKDEVIKINYNDLQGKKFYTLMKRKELGGQWVFSETGAIL